MINFSAQATSQLQRLYDDLNITGNTKIGWVKGAKIKINNAVVSGNNTVNLPLGVVLSCDVEQINTEFTVKKISRLT